MGYTLWYSIQPPMQMCQSIKNGIYRKSVKSAKWVKAEPGSPRNRACNSVRLPVTRDLSPYEECAAQSNTPDISLSSNQFRLHTSLSLCVEPAHVRCTTYFNLPDWPRRKQVQNFDCTLGMTVWVHTFTTLESALTPTAFYPASANPWTETI